MEGLIAGNVVIFLILVAFVFMVILLPFSAYAAQLWAYRSHQELQKVTRLLAKIDGKLDDPLHGEVQRLVDKQVGKP